MAAREKFVFITWKLSKTVVTALVWLWDGKWIVCDAPCWVLSEHKPESLFPFPGAWSRGLWPPWPQPIFRQAADILHKCSGRAPKSLC